MQVASGESSEYNAYNHTTFTSTAISSCPRNAEPTTAPEFIALSASDEPLVGEPYNGTHCLSHNNTYISQRQTQLTACPVALRFKRQLLAEREARGGNQVVLRVAVLIPQRNVDLVGHGRKRNWQM